MQEQAGIYDVEVPEAIRRKRADFLDVSRLTLAIRLAKMEESCDGILVLFDADDDCPAEVGPRIQEEVSKVAGETPCAVVLASREYEAWFLASIESLHGKRGILPSAKSHSAPETPRDAKGQLTKRMSKNRTYGPMVDQEALSALFDMKPSFRASRSFRKLTSAVGELLAAMGYHLGSWPPEGWSE